MAALITAWLNLAKLQLTSMCWFQMMFIPTHLHRQEAELLSSCVDIHVPISDLGKYFISSVRTACITMHIRASGHRGLSVCIRSERCGCALLQCQEEHGLSQTASLTSRCSMEANKGLTSESAVALKCILMLKPRMAMLLT